MSPLTVLLMWNGVIVSTLRVMCKRVFRADFTEVPLFHHRTLYHTGVLPRRLCGGMVSPSQDIAHGPTLARVSALL